MTKPWTHKKLTDVKDSAPDFGFDELQEARFAARDLDAEHTGVGFLRVKPGKRQGFAHKHDEAEEIYVVVEGGGRVKLDDDIVELEVLDAIRVAPTVTRQFEGGPDGIGFIAFGRQHKSDGEVLPGWWED